jgi:hypothetical protein
MISVRGNQTKLWNVTKLLKNRHHDVYQFHDFNVCTTESEVEASIEIIRNSVNELTPNALTNTIQSLRLTKAAGPDQIKLPRKSILYLTHIMNACFKYSYFRTA